MMQDQLYSYIKTTTVKRWEFFSEDELRCKGTDELDMDEEFTPPAGKRKRTTKRKTVVIEKDNAEA